MAKVFDSRVGHGNYRLTRYKGQIIGVELWPDKKGENEAQAYLVFKFAYKSPGPVAQFVRRALRRG